MQAFLEAVAGGELEIVQKLISTITDINEHHPHSQSTALHYAAAGGHLEVAAFLVSRGIGLDLIDFAGRTPLHVAIGKSREDMAKMLIRAGANCGIRDADGLSPLDTAITRKLKKVVKLLAGRGVSLNEFGAQFDDAEEAFLPLTFAAIRGSLDIFEMLIRLGANIECAYKVDNSLCEIMIGPHGAKLIRILTRMGFDIDLRNGYGQTVLQSAIICEEQQNVPLLLEMGADLFAEHGAPFENAFKHSMSSLTSLRKIP